MHKQFGIVGLVFAGLVPTLALGAAAGAHGTGSSTIPFADARLKIEYNATDGDAGLQVLLDAPPWRELSISNPFGRKVPEVEAEEVIRNYDLTELFSESSEPPFEEFAFRKFKRLFPSGVYTFRGVTIDGRAVEEHVHPDPQGASRTHDRVAGRRRHARSR